MLIYRLKSDNIIYAYINMKETKPDMELVAHVIIRFSVNRTSRNAINVNGIPITTLLFAFVMVFKPVTDCITISILCRDYLQLPITYRQLHRRELWKFTSITSDQYTRVK